MRISSDFRDRGQESTMFLRRYWPLAFLILCLGLELLVSADEGVDQIGVGHVEADSSKPAFANEAEALKWKLKTLDDLLEKKESSLQDKVKRIHFLENDLEVLQKSGNGESEKRLEAAKVREKELEAHVEKLQENVRMLEAHIQTLQSRIESSEATINELSAKNAEAIKSIEHQQKHISNIEETLRLAEVEKLQENVRMLEAHIQTLQSRIESSEATINELSAKNAEAIKSIEHQQKHISNIEETLRLAEAALQRAESEAAKWTRQLTKAYQAWLPPWAATRAAQLQESVTSKWVTHGEPILNNIREKASQSSAAAHNFVKPHIETVNKKWIHSLKKKWEKVSTNFAPSIEILKTRMSDGLQHTKAYTSNHLIKFRAIIRPYTQRAWKKMHPYVSKASAYLQPHFNSLHKFVAPYTKRIHRMYRRLSRLAKNHHYQLQRNIKRTLSKNKYSAKFAARKELIWFLASTLLLLPALCLLLLISSQFGGRKKTSTTTRKPGSSLAGSSNKKHRRAKQVEKY